MRLLILGGTTEAAELARVLAGDVRFAVTVSLAGRTKAPAPLPVPTRIGGFGGVEGLCAWLEHNATDAVIDATHPYAAQISANAVAAAARAGLPLYSLLRAPWQPCPGDDWHEAPDAAAAATHIARRFSPPATLFLTVGRLELAPFLALGGYRLVVRTIDPVELPHGAIALTDRGPFSLDAETRLLTEHGATVLVTKNSGGAATSAKLAAARSLGLPVVLVARPPKLAGRTVHSVAELLAVLSKA
jgi:precorrin-6A/cobalt-precorrin-6A reductase